MLCVYFSWMSDDMLWCISEFRNCYYHHFLYRKALGKLQHDLQCPLPICYSDNKMDITPRMTLGKSLTKFKPVIYEMSEVDSVTSQVPANTRSL